MKEYTHSQNRFIRNLLSKASVFSKRIVLTDGTDRRVLAAAHTLLSHSVIQPILVGPTEVILSEFNQLGISGTFEIYDPERDPRQTELMDLLAVQLKKRGKRVPDRDALRKMSCYPTYCGVLLVKSGIADGMVGGASVPTANVIRAGIQVVELDPQRPVVSGAFIMLLAEPLAGGQDALVFADAAVIPEPTAEQLASIAMNTASITRAVLGKEPVVAFLSFSTYGSAEYASVTKVQEALQLVRQRNPDFSVDGEMQLDAAIVPAISASKAPGNLLQGQANVLIFPNLEAGNIAYKLVERVGKATALGVILSGLSKPINDLSRGCSSDDVLNMVAVTTLQCLQTRTLLDVSA